ncbi:MAG: tetratricopeptide repeat protein [Bacteroidales bacterium]|nr:tetratricopeptide repeat protein [Bacteroidales bacterium]
MKKGDTKVTLNNTEKKFTNTRKWIFAGLALWCFVLYGNTLFNDYSLDDELVTSTNPQVSRGVKALPEIFTSFYYTENGNAGTIKTGYRPITKATYAIEMSIFGPKPGVSHFINVLLYILTALLLYTVLARLLKNHHPLFPLITTLLFISHPIHTEVVASLKNREEILSFLGALGGMYYFLKYADLKQTKYLIFGILAFIGGYLSKSNILTFLAIYPLTLYFFTETSKKQLWIITVSVVIAGLAAQIIPTLLLPDSIRPNLIVENPLFVEKSLWLRIGTGMSGMLLYLKLLVWPDPMLFYYGYDMIQVIGALHPTALISIAIHLALFIFAVLTFRKKHLLSYAILFYLVVMSMFSNILIPVVGIVADRFLYVSSLGFVLAITWIIFRLFEKNIAVQKLTDSKMIRIWMLTGLLLIPSMVVVINRNKDWKDVPSLYQADVKNMERSVKGNTQFAGNMMYTVFQQQSAEKTVDPRFPDLMLKHYQLALAILPTYYDALNGAGTVYSTFKNDYKNAIPYFNAAMQSDSANVASYVNLAYCYSEMGKTSEAIKMYYRVLEKDSTKIQALFKIGELYFKEGNMEKAVETNEQAIKLNPYTEIPYLNIGNFYLIQSDTNTAVSWYEKAVEIQPIYETSQNLYMHYSQKGNSEKAEYYRKKAAEAKNVVTIKR